MSAKVACLIPHRWSIEEYGLHTCADRSHSHLSRTECAESLRFGFVEIVRSGDRRLHRKMVVRMLRTLPLRGLSCSVGAGLVLALGSNDRNWALAMLSQVRMRNESRLERTRP